MKEILCKINPKFYIALSGILLGISVIFAEVGIIAYFVLVPMALALYKKLFAPKYRAKSAYLDGFIFFFSFDLVAFHWFCYFYPLDFAGIDNIQAIGVILLAWFGISALQSAFSAFVFVVLSKAAKINTVKENPVLVAFLAAALFAVNEWTQTFYWVGVPWSRIAISQTEMPYFLQTASLFGSYFITFIIVLCNFLLALAIFNGDKKKLALKVLCGVMSAFLVCSAVLYFIPTKDESQGIKIATVQGNISSQDRVGDVFCQGTLAHYIDLSRRAAEDGAEIIVWPEGVFPRDIYSSVDLDGRLVKINKALEELSSELGVTIILGTLVKDNVASKTYNSISAFYPNGNSKINAYSKIHLVPFGEFLPLRGFIESVAPTLAQINTLSSELTHGEKSSVFGARDQDDDIKIGAMLCYDSIYEILGINSAREGADIFVIPSDDSWFYDSRALNMHHSQNILRAVEQGKYTVSSGNSGISSIVTDKGEVLGKLPIFTDGYFIETVYPTVHRTLYSYIGNLFVYLCIAFVVSPIIIDKIPRKKR